jgi:hypothetical protein
VRAWFFLLVVTSEYDLLLRELAQGIRVSLHGLQDTFVDLIGIHRYVLNPSSFGQDSEAWIDAANAARDEIFSLISQNRLVVVYVAREASVARRTHEAMQNAIDRALHRQLNHQRRIGDIERRT